MNRRDYIRAAAALLGVPLTGCATQQTMSEEEAHDQFTGVQEFDSPHRNYDDAVRFVDEDAGVVLYALSLGGSSHGGKGVGLSSVPLEATDLDE